MSKPLYVTTSIPYVNAPPHLGFALELLQADVYTRFHHLAGRSVRLQTGTDENAFKNVLSAVALGIPTEQLVKQNADRFQQLADGLNVSYDSFVRTTSAAHRNAVHAFLSRLQSSDVYHQSYRGLYCNGCEDFYLPRELENGRCPDHPAPLSEVEEHNYFFRLSRYQSRLHELITTRELRVLPSARESEVLRFIEGGLADISISRDAARSGGWGIPFPDDESQVVYVWIDALVNYLTGLGYPESHSLWSNADRLHVIGKNVWKFHAVYWPALLLSAGLPLPDTIFAHGFLTIDGEKISKSGKHRGADPFEQIARFGCDAVRYYLIRHVRPFEDTDFSTARLERIYISELANGLGNLASRLTRLCEIAELAGVPADQPREPAGLTGAIHAFRFDRAISAIWSEVDALNQEIADVKPWTDPRAFGAELKRWAHRLLHTAFWLEPFLPQTSRRIRGALSVSRIRKLEPLFPRSMTHGTNRVGGDIAGAARGARLEVPLPSLTAQESACVPPGQLRRARDRYDGP